MDPWGEFGWAIPAVEGIVKLVLVGYAMYKAYEAGQMLRKSGLNWGAPHPPLRPAKEQPYRGPSYPNPLQPNPGNNNPKLPPWAIPLPLLPEGVREYCELNPSAGICKEFNPEPEQNSGNAQKTPCSTGPTAGSSPLPPYADRDRVELYIYER